MRKLLILASLVLAAACGGDSSTAPAPTVTGTWRGSSGGVTLSLTLVQAGTSVTGNGQISGTQSVAVNVAGTFANPTVSLNMTATGFQDINYAGPLSGTIINGTLNGSGFNNIAIPLTRQ